MGVVVLAVAVLPMLGVGGFQLYRAETPGAVKDTKLTPRITETAKALWYVYLGLTIACTVSFWAAGMTLFDAICHAFATMATGGFSTHDASLAYFHSPLIDIIAIVFMVLAGTNFALHFLVWRSRSLRTYLRDPEFKAYLTVLCALSVFVAPTCSSRGSTRAARQRRAGRHFPRRLRHDQHGLRPPRIIPSGPGRCRCCSFSACSSAAAAAPPPAA